MSQLLAGMSLQVPPLLLGTLVKHYLARKKITADNKARDEFLYDEVCIGAVSDYSELLTAACVDF